MDKEHAYDHIRSKFVELKETRNIIKKYNLKIKYGYLSEEETSIVKRIVEEFLCERRLTMNDLQKHLIEGSEFPIHDLLYACTQASKYRTYKSIHTHIAYLYHPYIHASWNSEEEIRLLDLVNEKGFVWKEISYYLSKYKDMCRTKYLSLRGQGQKRLTKRKIVELLTGGLPCTETEWKILCDETKMNRKYIERCITKYLNGKELRRHETREIDIHLCLMVLRNNYRCGFEVNIDEIMRFIDSSFSSELTDQNRIEERFMKRFAEILRPSGEFDLDIDIEKDDIFWFNISRDMMLEKPVIIAKFNEMCVIHGWTTFRNVYDTVIKMSYEHMMAKMKCSMLARCLGMGRKNTKEIDGPDVR